MKIGIAYMFVFLFLAGSFVSAIDGKCVQREGKCCVGDVCESISGECESGESEVVTCDADCWPIFNCKTINTSVLPPEDALGCKNLYWIDNENKSCSQKEFCGAFMYYGLQTFETKGECQSTVSSLSVKHVCTAEQKNATICTMTWMPVCGSDGKTHGNECEACADQVEYWTQGECSNKTVNNGSCIEQNGICCREGRCSMIDVECTPGLSYSFEGCDSDCNTIFNCINKTKIFNLSNGRKAEIKIMSETASEKAIAVLGRLNFTIELKEVGSNRTAYELTSEKQGKFLGLFKIKGNVSIQVDAETGEVLKAKKPWWAFLVSGI